MAPAAISVVNSRMRGESNAKPILQPHNALVSFEDVVSGPIKNLCCVGAGYVGELLSGDSGFLRAMQYSK